MNSKNNSAFNPPNTSELHGLSKISILVILAALVFIVFSECIHNEFVYYDDDMMVFKNTAISSPFPGGIADIFMNTSNAHFQPLVNLSYWTEFQLFGLNPIIFHFNNVLLHALNSFLVYLLFLKLSGKKLPALVGALIFAVHPMHVESVAWITSRKDLLYSLFYLSAMLTYLKFLDSGQKKNKWAYPLTLLLFIFSASSKVMAVTLPLLLILLDWFKTGTLVNHLKNKIPFFLIGLFFGIINIFAEFYNNIETAAYNVIDRILIITYSLLWYPFKSILPVGLSAIYPYPVKNGAILPFVFILSPIAVIALFYIFKKLFKGKKDLIFGLSFYSLTILPALPFTFFGISVYADRFIYLPVIGIIFLAITLGNRIFEYNIFNSRGRAVIKYSAPAIIIIALAIGAYTRCSVWKDTPTLANDILAKNPESYYAYYIEGNYYSDKPDPEKAIICYKKAIGLKPEYLNAYFNLGNAYYSAQDNKNAIICFEKVLTLDPNDKEAMNNLAIAYQRNGDMLRALNFYRKSAALGYQPAQIWLKANGYLW